MNHAFNDLGETVTDKAGRRLRVCGTCGKLKIGIGHRSPSPPPSRAQLIETAPDKPVRSHPAARPTKEKAVAAYPAQPIPERPVYGPEIRLLAFALDVVLEQPIDRIGWRVNLRATDLRSLIDIPRENRPPTPPSDDPLEPDTEPRAYLSNGRQVPRSEVSRAREQTKRINDRRVRALAVRAIVDGWTFRLTRGGQHGRLERHGQAVGFTLSSLDGARGGGGWQNLRAHAKRIGIDVTDL